MKRLFLAFCLTALVCPVLQAQNPTPDEINKAVRYLESTRAGVYLATSGLSEAQWNFKPATNRWSVAEVTEHIAAAEDSLRAMVQTNVMKAPPRAKPVDVTALDEFVLQKIPDRTTKAQAPEALQPSNRFGSAKASLQHFRVSRSQTIDFLKNTDNLRGHATDSPLGKPLDGYQWILFIAAHTDRHTKQILEVKAAPDFPKK
jgi:hypothetical protein